MSEALSIVRAVAAFGLMDVGRAPVPHELWPEVLGHLIFEHLTGLAVAMLENDRLVISARQERELYARQREAMTLALANERKLLEVGDALERSGIEFIVLKGPAVAHAFYPDPSWRPFVDIDILVRTRDWKDACSVLAALGMRRRLPEPRRNFDVRFGKAAAHRGDDGLEVDLHRTLVLGPFGLWMEAEELFEHTAVLSLGGRAVKRLDNTAALLNACIHASLGSWPPRLLPLRDVAQVAFAAEIDWGRLAYWGSKWRMSVVIEHAFEIASRRLRFAIPAPALLLTGGPRARQLRWALHAYTTNRRQRGATALATLAAIRGLRQKTAYLSAMAFPNRDFLITRGESNGRRTYLSRWGVAAQWLSLPRRR